MSYASFKQPKGQFLAFLLP